MSGVVDCLRRPRRGPPVGAALRWFRRSLGWRVRRSIAARMISTRNRCRRGKFAAPVAGVARCARTIRGLVGALERLVEPATLGDPMRPLIWVSKSMEKLAAALTEMGHPVSADTVRPKGNPQRVNVHDFEDKKLGKVVPYGVYDVTADPGFVSVGITSDTG